MLINRCCYLMLYQEPYQADWGVHRSNLLIKKEKYSYDDNFRDDEVEDLENGKNVDSDDDDD